MQGIPTWGSPVLEAEARAAQFYRTCEVSAAFTRARYPTALDGWGSRNMATPTRSFVSNIEIARARMEGIISEAERVFRALRQTRGDLRDAVRALPPDDRARARRALKALARRMKHAD